METQELHRGRLIDHIHLVVKDLKQSRKFYEALFKVLKIPIGGAGEEYFWVDELFISSKKQTGQGQLTGRHHLAFQASSQEIVNTAYRHGLEAGGEDNGAPGPRPYHPGYYAGFLLDPDGNNIEVVYHGPAKKSAESVKITF